MSTFIHSAASQVLRQAWQTQFSTRTTWSTAVWSNGSSRYIKSTEKLFASIQMNFSLLGHRPGKIFTLTCPLLPKKFPDMVTNTPDISASINTEDHQRMRKVYSSGFAERALQKQEPLIQKPTDLHIKRLQALVKVAEKGLQGESIFWSGTVSFRLIS